MNRFLLICASSMYLCASSVMAEDAITVSWRIKPPHQYLENGVEQGILLDRAKQIFALSQLPHRFVEEPAKRIWSNFSSGMKNYCSFGWYKIPERESLVQFSDTFHTDPPHTLLVSPAALKLVAAHKNLASLMNDKTLTVGVVDAVSYGPELDAMIKASKNKVERSTTLPMIMARMVAANRASYMFIDREDWEFLKNKEESLRLTAQMDLPGMPAGLNRYIVCSKDISAEQMQKLNVGLQKVYPQKK